MRFVRLILLFLAGTVLAACGDNHEAQQPSTPAGHATQVKSATSSRNSEGGAASKGAGGVTIQILPEYPDSTTCLRAVIKGIPGRSTVIWKVNNEIIATGTDTQLCNDSFKRGDYVSVSVGTLDEGAQASVSIANSPPKIVDISSSPAEISSGTDISVVPEAEDADGDEVTYSYQWLINGDVDPLLTDATLPGSRVKKGDTVKVLIVPNDFYDDGPTYESFAMPIPNAAPRITSQPPQQITSLDYRYQVEVDDPDDSHFSYRLDEAPEGMSIDQQSGLIQWSLLDVKAGDYTVAIVVTDPDGAEGAQEYKLTLGNPQ